MLLAVMMMMVVFVCVAMRVLRRLRCLRRLSILQNFHAGRRDPTAIDFADDKRCVKIESFHSLVKNFRRNAGVEKSSEKHVAAYAGEAV